MFTFCVNFLIGKRSTFTLGIPIHHQVIQVINGSMIEKYDDMQPIEFLSCPHVESRYIRKRARQKL